MNEPVGVSSDSPVSGAVTVTLNTTRDTNPSYAITREMWEQIQAAFVQLAKDHTVRVIILRGADGRFASGANFLELLEIVRRDRAAGNDQGAQAYWRLVNYANTAIENCPKPVIAVIERWALGAACALALACDFRIAAVRPNPDRDPRRATRIGVPAPQKGLTLGLNDTRRLVNAVGSSHARQLLIEGREYSAEEAHAMGLIDRIVPETLLEGVVSELATRLANENAPLAMREAKANIASVVRNPGFAGLDETSMPIAWAGSRDLEEGITAFLEGRDPVFTGE